MIENRSELISHGIVGLRRKIINILSSLLEEIRGDKIVRNKVKSDGKNLKIENISMDLNFENLYVIGFGKSSGELALALEDILGDRISGGIINTNHEVKLKRIKVNIASHPLPDEKTVIYSREILDFLKNSGKRDLVIVLVSGGASSLFEVPKKGISLDKERKIVENMMKSGVNIEDINRMRISLSSVKGGKLLNYIYPSQCLSLILSDVIGDAKFVGSGPTFFQEKYKICENIVIGDNNYAKEKAREIAEKMGFNTKISNTNLRGEPRDISENIFKEFKRSNEKIMIWGGETTVNIQKSSGIGGRNQELSLYLGKRISGKNMAFSCIGTDGIDGPTDAAGGIADGYTMDRLQSLKINLDEKLKEHDSYNVLKVLGDLIITGDTGSNLADICIGIKD